MGRIQNFRIGGGANARGSIETERRASMIEYMQVPVLSNCILTVAHTQSRHLRSTCIYELIVIYMN